MKLGSLHKQRSTHPHLIAAAEKEAMGPTQSKEQVANATTCDRRLETDHIVSKFTFISYERPQTEEFTLCGRTVIPFLICIIYEVLTFFIVCSLTI